MMDQKNGAKASPSLCIHIFCHVTWQFFSLTLESPGGSLLPKGILATDATELQSLSRNRVCAHSGTLQVLSERAWASLMEKESHIR